MIKLIKQDRWAVRRRTCEWWMWDRYYRRWYAKVATKNKGREIAQAMNLLDKLFKPTTAGLYKIGR